MMLQGLLKDWTERKYCRLILLTKHDSDDANDAVSDAVDADDDTFGADEGDEKKKKKKQTSKDSIRWLGGCSREGKRKTL